jgi:hypothetical protein
MFDVAPIEHGDLSEVDDGRMMGMIDDVSEMFSLTDNPSFIGPGYTVSFNFQAPSPAAMHHSLSCVPRPSADNQNPVSLLNAQPPSDAKKWDGIVARHFRGSLA